MYICYGNCQARNVSEELERRGECTIYRHIRSTFATLNTNCSIDNVFQSIVTNDELSSHFGDDAPELINVLTPQDNLSSEDVIFINTFHEPHNWRVYRHVDNNYIMTAQRTCLEASPDLARHVAHKYEPVVSKQTYVYRFIKFVEDVIQKSPAANVVIFVRAAPAQAYNPAPFSYLMHHDIRWKTMERLLLRLQQKHARLRLLHIDAMATAYLLLNKSKTVDNIFNRFRIENKKELVIRRDIEHFSKEFLSFCVENMFNDTLPSNSNFLSSPYQHPPLDDKNIQKNLSSEEYFSMGLFLCFLSSSDKSNLVIQHAETSPICPHTLHLLKWYALMRPNPRWRMIAANQYEKLLRLGKGRSGFVSIYKQKLNEFVQSTAK